MPKIYYHKINGKTYRYNAATMTYYNIFYPNDEITEQEMRQMGKVVREVVEATSFASYSLADVPISSGEFFVPDPKNPGQYLSLGKADLQGVVVEEYDISNLVSIYVQIAKEIPEGDDWDDHRPYGIACIGVKKMGSAPIFYYDREEDGTPAKVMSLEYVLEVTDSLQSLYKAGVRFVGWNSLKFDMSVLYEESNYNEFWVECALNHFDLMYQVIKSVGFPMGREKAAKAEGIACSDYNYKDLPEAWKVGNHDIVFRCMMGILTVTLELAILYNAGNFNTPGTNSYRRMLFGGRILPVRLLLNKEGNQRARQVNGKFTDDALAGWMKYEK